MLVLFLLLMSIGGCTLIPKGVRKNLIVNYLNDKYTDDHFEFKSYSGGMPWSNESVTILCTSEKYPDKMIKASYITDMDKYEDNYLGYKYTKQLDEYVENYAKGLFPEHNIKIFATSDDIGNIHELDLPADTTFEDYIKNGREDIWFCCEYDPEEFEKDKAEIEKRVVESTKNLDMKVIGIDIRFTQDVSKDLKTITEDTYNSLHIRFELDGNNDSNNKINSIKWEN